MTATLIDGKAVAVGMRREIAGQVAALPFKPGLAVVLVGEDPASQVYVRSKAKQTIEVGMASFEHRLPADTSQAALLDLIGTLNRDPAVDGILLQLPLPPQIDANAVLRAVDPAKDVDGFHPLNVGLVAIGAGGLAPCTPVGSMRLIRTVRTDLAGLNAVVIGRSNIVGKPMAQLLLEANCTVAIAHSRTADLPALARTADILVAAVGRPEFVKGDWIKPGAVVIDVGINRVPAGDKTRLVGDVDFEAAARVAGAITPVPGGVGPLTIATLLENCLKAALARRAN